MSNTNEPSTNTSIVKEDASGIGSTGGTGNGDERIVVIRLKGMIGVKERDKRTFNLLNLNKKFACVIIPNTPQYKGMIKRIASFITYGPINASTEEKLIKLHGEKDSDGKVKSVFRLHPPVKGFERMGLKHPFSRGGAYGNRGEKINELIERMI